MWFLEEFRVSEILCTTTFHTICTPSFDIKCVQCTVERLVNITSGGELGIEGELIDFTTIKGVHVCQVISLDFESIHWSSEQGLMNCTHIL